MSAACNLLDVKHSCSTIMDCSLQIPLMKASYPNYLLILMNVW